MDDGKIIKGGLMLEAKEVAMPELFSVLLQGVLSSAAGWATTKILNVVTGCPSCSSENHRTISNYASNELTCPSCTNRLSQYSIATPTTVRDGRLMGANIFNPHWEQHSESQGWFVPRLVRNWFILDLSTVGMQYHGMVVKGTFRDMKSSASWPTQNLYLNNDYERSSFARVGWPFDARTFPRYSAIVADVSVETLEGDKLHSVSPLANFG
jgi:hypothetical protein